MSENKSVEQIEFDEVATLEMFRAEDEKRFADIKHREDMALVIGLVSSAKTDGARWQFARDKLAYETKLANAEALITRLESDIKRRMNSDEQLELSFDEDFGEALNLIKTWRSK